MKEICELVLRYPALEECKESIAAATLLLENAFRAGNKLLVCGNGGSASDALHIVGELMKGFILPRALSDEEAAALRAAGDDGTLAAHLQGALPAVAIGVEAALQTAYANDAAPRLAFAQQVYGLGKEGDVLLAISTSGNSQNCIYAAVAARAKGMKPKSSISMSLRVLPSALLPASMDWMSLSSSAMLAFASLGMSCTKRTTPITPKIYAIP